MNIDRYSKQIRFVELGQVGQKKLGEARIAVVGVGATGSFIANLLARAGVGYLRLIDRDFVETSNLQRQILYEESDVQECLPKAVAAKSHIARINSEITVDQIVADFNSKNVHELLTGIDLVIDGSDNFLTRYLINDACVKLGLPWIYTGVIGEHGVSFAIQVAGPCLRCYLLDPPLSGQLETCDTAGILASTVFALGSFSATSAMKILCKKDVDAQIILANVWEPNLTCLKVKKNPQCPCCGEKNFEFLTGKFEPETVSLCGRNAVHIQSSNPDGFKIELVTQRIKQIDIQAVANQHTLKFSVEECEFVVFKDGRAIIKGLSDVMRARALYSRYIDG